MKTTIKIELAEISYRFLLHFGKITKECWNLVLTDLSVNNDNNKLKRILFCFDNRNSNLENTLGIFEARNSSRAYSTMDSLVDDKWRSSLQKKFTYLGLPSHANRSM